MRFGPRFGTIGQPMALRRLGIARPAPAAAPSGPAYTNTEASDLAARMSVAPTTGRASAIDALVGSLKTGATSGTNIWSKLSVLLVFAAADKQAAYLNWKTGSYGNCADGAGGAPDFLADRGVIAANAAGGGIVSDYNPTDNGGFTSANVSIGVFTTESTNDMVQGDGAGFSTTYRLNATNESGLSGARLASSLNLAVAPDGANPHHVAGSRTSTTSAFAYRNGVAGVQKTNSSTSVIPATGAKLTIGASSTSATPSAFRRIGAVHVGTALNAAEHLDLYNALRTYLVAVGVTGI